MTLEDALPNELFLKVLEKVHEFDATALPAVLASRRQGSDQLITESLQEEYGKWMSQILRENALSREDAKHPPDLHEDASEEFAMLHARFGTCTGLSSCAAVSRRWALLVAELQRSPEWKATMLCLDPLENRGIDLGCMLDQEASPDLRLKGRPDLCVVFESQMDKQHPPLYHRLPYLRRMLGAALAPSTPIVCVQSPGGVLGPLSSTHRANEPSAPPIHEVQGADAMSFTTMRFPSSRVHPFCIQNLTMQSIKTDPEVSRLFAGDWASFVLFTGQAGPEHEAFIKALYDANPAARVIGGVASGFGVEMQRLDHPRAKGPESMVTFDDHPDLVGFAIGREVGSDCLCSRGCDLLTEPLRIEDMAGKGIRTVSDSTGTTDFMSIVQQKYEQGVMFGHAAADDAGNGYTLISPSQNDAGLLVVEEAKQGDFLRLGKLSPHACKRDVQGRLQALGHAKDVTKNPAAGAFLFSCAGRGRQFYGEQDVDSNAFTAGFPRVPLAGFFAGGELGPVARIGMDPSHVTEAACHSEFQGFTSVFGVFSAGGRWDSSVVFDDESGDLEATMAAFMGQRKVKLGPLGLVQDKQRIEVQGLQKAAQHNGKQGVVRDWLEDKERYQVRLDDGGILAIKKDNMELL